MKHNKSKGYKVDFLIPIGLGGANNLANLWPQAVNLKPGYDEKKKAEQYLYGEVCSGRMSLSRAQKMIADNWLGVYRSMR